MAGARGSGGKNRKLPDLRLLEGNPGKRPIPEMPEVDVSDADVPAMLRGDLEAMTYWQETTPHLIRLKILTKLNWRLYAKGCQYWSRSCDPALAFGKQLVAFTNAYKIFRDFGGTPVDMMKLSKAPLKESPGTKWGAAL